MFLNTDLFGCGFGWDLVDVLLLVVVLLFDDDLCKYVELYCVGFFQLRAAGDSIVKRRCWELSQGSRVK